MSKKHPKSNMYPWVDEMISHLHGQCSHRCAYCYVPSTRAGKCGIYTGPVTLSEASLRWKPKSASKTIFVDHMNDLFAADVPGEWIERVFEHCSSFAKDRVLVFQTKNPRRALRYLRHLACVCGKDWLLGTTLETNRAIAQEISQGPSPFSRYDALLAMAPEDRAEHLFITVEPIMDFDSAELALWISKLRPKFINIGADSKGHHLPEPETWKVGAFISALNGYGIQILEKHNLERLLPILLQTTGVS